MHLHAIALFFNPAAIVTRPSGNCTHYQYEPLGRLVAAVSLGGLRRGLKYDAEDNLLLYTDAAGHQTRFAYSALNKLCRRTNADGTHIGYRYDSEERLPGSPTKKARPTALPTTFPDG